MNSYRCPIFHMHLGNCVYCEGRVCEDIEIGPMNGDAWCHSENHQNANKRIEELETFVYDVLQWSKAYPKDVFTEPTPEQVDAVCKTLGFRIDRISAMVLREFTKAWGAKADKLLSGGGKDE